MVASTAVHDLETVIGMALACSGKLLEEAQIHIALRFSTFFNPMLRILRNAMAVNLVA